VKLVYVKACTGTSAKCDGGSDLCGCVGGGEMCGHGNAGHVIMRSAMTVTIMS